MRYKCACCGNYTLIEKHDDICPVCYWQEDIVQEKYPDFEGGANEVNLKQERENYKIFDVSDKMFIDKVRKPFSNELPENNLG